MPANARMIVTATTPVRPVDPPSSLGSGSGMLTLALVGGGALVLFLYLRSRKQS
jgi:uncharacterized protein involved in exopolysaccharide biosynthesis